MASWLGAHSDQSHECSIFQILIPGLTLCFTAGKRIRVWNCHAICGHQETIILASSFGIFAYIIYAIIMKPSETTKFMFLAFDPSTDQGHEQQTLILKTSFFLLWAVPIQRTWDRPAIVTTAERRATLFILSIFLGTHTSTFRFVTIREILIRKKKKNTPFDSSAHRRLRGAKNESEWTGKRKAVTDNELNFIPHETRGKSSLADQVSPWTLATVTAHLG